MAHVYVGNLPKANVDILDAFLELDDSYWVFAEFTIGSGPRSRQVDWLILRAVPDDRPTGAFSTLIVAEQKETTATLTGLENNVWNEHRNGVDSPLVMSNRQDLNPLQQAINTGNAVKDWLWNHERLFVDQDRPPYAVDDFNVWPTLLIVSPPDVQHRLPRRLYYGAIWLGVDGWLGAIRSWVPRRGLQLTRAELERLARVVADSSGIAPWDPPRPADGGQPVPLPPVTSDPEQPLGDQPEGKDEEAGPNDLAPDDLGPTETTVVGLAWLNDLAAWVGETERRLERLERGSTPPAPRPTRRSVRADDRFTPEERRMVEMALRRVRDRSGKPDFPNVFSELRSLNGGESLKNANFLGWGSGRTMMDQAVAEGWLAYGPVDLNGLPTLCLVEQPG